MAGKRQVEKSHKKSILIRIRLPFRIPFLVGKGQRSRDHDRPRCARWVAAGRISLVALAVWWLRTLPREIPYSELAAAVQAGRVQSVEVADSGATGRYTDGSRFRTTLPSPHAEAVNDLLRQPDATVTYSTDHGPVQVLGSFVLTLLGWLIPIALLGYFLYRSADPAQGPAHPRCKNHVDCH